ncbi:unnamed protein product, partial [Chrysoparadoxa australica]
MNQEAVVATEVGGVEEELAQAMGSADEGAGVFGALLHIPQARAKVLKDAQEKRRMLRGDMASDLDGTEASYESEDEDEGPPKYMINREVLTAELEQEMKTTPFETYDLFRGQKFGGGEDYRQVGIFKCIVRVTEGDPDDEPLFVPDDKKKNDEVLGELLKPSGYKVRLYVLQALNLTPMDLGIGGRPGKSDPYVLVQLGKEKFDDVKNYINDVTDADLYKCVEINAELPGAGQLILSLMDYDDIGANELIGRTVIDLEDRWFDQRWQQLGMENRCEDMTGPSSMRWQTKPVEQRSLYVPTSNAAQGVVQCWVDIMPPADANAFVPEDVALPPSGMFEVRVVIWHTKDVVSMDDLTGMNDLFVKAWVEGCDPQETDTHWRAKKGKGVFNWRMIFKVELGPRSRSMKFPYLTLQMWDKVNDCIAEGSLDLGKYFRRAYKKKKVQK